MAQVARDVQQPRPQSHGVDALWEGLLAAGWPAVWRDRPGLGQKDGEVSVSFGSGHRFTLGPSDDDDLVDHHHLVLLAPMLHVRAAVLHVLLHGENQT